MFALYHGAQRWSGTPAIVQQRKGHAEHGPGIYLTTSWETARKYSRGGGSVYRMLLEQPRAWVEDARIPVEETAAFLRATLGRGKSSQTVLDAVHRVSARAGDPFPANVLINAFVNNNLLAGRRGPAVAEFLTSRGIEASHVSQGDEDWVVVFNPGIIRRVERVTPQEVDPSGFLCALPRVFRGSR
jgi:hypothetical protein